MTNSQPSSPCNPQPPVVTMSERTNDLWAKLMAGAPEVDENVLITSAMVNQQTMDNMAGITSEENTQPRKETMTTKNPAKLSEFDSIDQLKESADVFAELYDRFDFALSLPFAEYYAKYYRVMNDIPKPDTDTKFSLVEVNRKSASFVVHGYTKTDLEINPNPTPQEDPDREPDDYYIMHETHTRELFVTFPLDFLEDRTPYLKEAEHKKAVNSGEAKKAAEAELQALLVRKKELKEFIRAAESNV